MFCADIIGPLVKRVMRALGIDTKTEKNFIAPEQTVNIYPTGLPGVKMAALSLRAALNTPPEKLFISINGEVTECTKREIDGNVCYGNPAIMGAEVADSGEPFCFAADASETWEGAVKVDDDVVSVTLSAWTETETTTPISDKYLPGPVVIDLAEYGIDFTSLIMAGGGVKNGVETGTFWKDVNALSRERQLILTSIASGATLYPFGVTKVYSNSNEILTLLQIVISLPLGGNLITANCLLQPAESGADANVSNITAIVSTAAIPTTEV